MHRRSLLTVLRGFLLSLFVLGGPGLPLIDAVVWHGSGAEQLAGSRVNAQGAPRSHADDCALAAPLPVPGPVPCTVQPTPGSGAAPASPIAVLHLVRVTFTPDSSARPRAPPVVS